jgi:Fuc2NAc and GlcNAc transferase
MARTRFTTFTPSARRDTSIGRELARTGFHFDMRHHFLLIIFSVLSSILAAWLLTSLVRNHALARSIIDLPNDRSLHVTPTPRGGGISIVVVLLSFLLLAGVSRLLPWNVVIGLGGGGAAVALIGWLDDVSSVVALKRLLVHFAAAAWAVAWLGGFRFASLGGQQLDLGPVGSVLAVIGIVWATNLFNFMDGSDGIVAVEVASIGAIGGLLLLWVGNVGLGTLALVLAGAALGFAWWNWAPARIFLGDVGSGFVGFTIGALAVASENANAVPVAVWSLLSCIFLVDATLTLLRRLRLGHWKEPHRTHAYQVAIQGGWSHDAVATWVASANLVLGTLAATAMIGLLPLWLALGTALLVCGAFYALVVSKYSSRAVSAAKRRQ